MHLKLKESENIIYEDMYMNQISVDYFGYISYLEGHGILTVNPNGFESREFIHNFAFIVGNSSLQEVHHFKVIVSSPLGATY